jgi:small multidrug resistance family-3 protein
VVRRDARAVTPADHAELRDRETSSPDNGGMTTARIVILFALAAVAEIGGAWLIWQAVRENRGWWLALLGILALGAYGFIAALQPDAQFGRVLAAYGGVFVAGSLAWGIVVDGFRPTMWDYVGSAVALLGAGIIMLAPSTPASG